MGEQESSETDEPDSTEPAEEHTQLHRWSTEKRVATANRPRIRWRAQGVVHSHVLNELTVIGSAHHAGLVLADATVSRIHAELEEVQGDVWVRDLGSRNGTFVEGVRVGSARVPDGGRIRIGETELRVTYDGEGPDRELWPEPHFGPLVGASAVMRSLFAQLHKVAATDSSVLIRGETGTGKELVASAIHEASPRAGRPFVIIDCAALPEHLIEAELFGHARGAFTGAVAERVGAFQAADGGTIFLDEIGELPLTMQPKLLRAIESRCIRRVGETVHRPVNVRIVSATHRDLRTMVNAGAFREDLYFRLAVLPIVVPPLRERPDDVSLLVDHFLPPTAKHLSSALQPRLNNRPWLGNVRELRNFVERAVAFGTNEAVAMTFGEGRSVAPPPPSAPARDESDFDGDFRAFRERWLERGEREYVQRLLRAHAGVVAAAAQAAGLDRTYFYKLMRRLGVTTTPPR